MVQALIDSSKITKESKEESKKKCGIMVGKSVSQHFHLYMVRSPTWKRSSNRFIYSSTTFLKANVFFRLASEATFGILQLWLFGYKVKELFKCQGFPCPHVVDCFISRPAEKTIFLNFMLGTILKEFSGTHVFFSRCALGAAVVASGLLPGRSNGPERSA